MRREVACRAEHQLGVLIHCAERIYISFVETQFFCAIVLSALTEMFRSVSLCCRGNHCCRITVPILDHRHSSNAERQEDESFHHKPIRLSFTQ